MNPTSDRSMSSGQKGRYKCEDCHRVFAVKGELATHMMIHNGERTHSCTRCEKEFGTLDLLNQHLIWHFEEKPHVCPKCKKRFSYRRGLYQHIKIHPDDRPFACPQCHKRYINELNLNRHMKTHQKSEFFCQECGELFLKQIELNAHLSTCKRQSSYLLHGAIDGLESPAPAMPLILTCMLCKSQFNNEASFASHMHHMHMNHFVNQNTNLSHHQGTSIGIQNVPNPIGFFSDPVIDTSYAPNLQNTSLLQLLESSCFGQSSVSPMSYSETSPQPSASESTSTTSSCKDCTNSWQRIHDLEQQVLEKDEKFENYKQMARDMISNVSNFLTTSATPENMSVINAADILTHLKNAL